MSKAFASLIGRIGKLHLVASPKTVKAVNDFYNALYEVYDGIVLAEDFNAFLPPSLTPVFKDKMEETDVGKQIKRLEWARIPLLTSMRVDLGYRMESRLKIKLLPKIKLLLEKKSLLKIKSLLKKISPLEREPLLIEHNSFTECFFRDRIKEGRALAVADDTASGAAAEKVKAGQ